MLKIVRDTPGKGIPEILEGCKGLIEFEYKARGIYFLFLNEQIVYIGQSTNLYARIQQHIIEGVKKFNRVFLQPLPNNVDMLAVEKHYILKFRPKYNYETYAKTCEPESNPEDIVYAFKQMVDKRVDHVYLQEAKDVKAWETHFGIRKQKLKDIQ